MKRLKGEKLLGYVIILPAVLYMLIFIGYPIIYNWILSLQDVTAKSLKSDIKNYVGLKNYIEIFSDPVFRDSILHTFIYTIGCLVIQFSFGFLFAMFFAKKFTFSKPIPNLSKSCNSSLPI